MLLARDALRADCARCFGLCCVAPALSKSSDFAIDKAAGSPCPNLGGEPGFRCRIHDELYRRGFAGCAQYDCFGAGQKISARGGGIDWRARLLRKEDPRAQFDDFMVMQKLHELLYYLREARSFERVPPRCRSELDDAFTEIEELTAAAVLARIDLEGLHARVSDLLSRASELQRACYRKRKNLRGADLVGASLRRHDLRGATLRGALLIGADLRDANLEGADLLGTDLRDADLSGANLAETLFLTRSQLRSAIQSE